MNDLDGYKRGMTVVAHPDDAEFGCAGTVAKFCDEGWEWVYVMCTDGSRGTSDREISPDELAEIRTKEQINAGKVLGLKDVVFLGYTDGILEPTLEVRRDIAREIRRYKPDVVISSYPSRGDLSRVWVGHPDHMAAGEATLSAVFPSARDHLSFPELLEEGHEPHRVSEVWINGHPDPDFWVDTAGHIEVSVKALLEHKSQVGDWKEEDALKMMQEWHRRTAYGHGMMYADSYKRIRFRRRRDEDEDDE